MKIIAVDFDGTICENAYPEIGEPHWKIINSLILEQSKGTKIILWTCRQEQYLEDAIRKCKEWGIEFDSINENLPELIEKYGNNCRKVSATEYWDDRAVPLNYFYDEGEWEIIYGVVTPGGDPWLRCPFCKEKNTEHLGGIEMPKRWNYCPNCGKRLAGDGHIKNSMEVRV